MRTIFLDLGLQPITNCFLPTPVVADEVFYPLRVQFDDDSALVSLVTTLRPELMFNETYAHRASASATMRESFRSVAHHIRDTFRPRRVLEIGSNDGAFISALSRDIVVAVEPCENLAGMTAALGYRTYPVFWNLAEAETIVKCHGEMDVIYAANTMSHIPGLAQALEAVTLALSDDGVFVFEEPSLLAVITNGSYDQFYDEHAHVFSVTAAARALATCGLEVFDLEELSTHGGSTRFYAKRRGRQSHVVSERVQQAIDRELAAGLTELPTYLRFAERVQQSRTDLVQLLSELKAQGKTIISYGATYKSATIFNFCQIGTSLLDCIVDTTPGKQGKFSPGMHIPIVSPEEGLGQTVDFAFLGAWNFRSEIIAKEREFVGRGGHFITHVPDVHIIKLGATSPRTP